MKPFEEGDVSAEHRVEGPRCEAEGRRGCRAPSLSDGGEHPGCATSHFRHLRGGSLQLVTVRPPHQSCGLHGAAGTGLLAGQYRAPRERCGRPRVAVRQHDARWGARVPRHRAVAIVGTGGACGRRGGGQDEASETCGVPGSRQVLALCATYQHTRTALPCRDASALPSRRPRVSPLFPAPTSRTCFPAHPPRRPKPLHRASITARTSSAGHTRTLPVLSTSAPSLASRPERRSLSVTTAACGASTDTTMLPSLEHPNATRVWQACTLPWLLSAQLAASRASTCSDAALT